MKNDEIFETSNLLKIKNEDIKKLKNDNINLKDDNKHLNLSIQSVKDENEFLKDQYDECDSAFIRIKKEFKDQIELKESELQTLNNDQTKTNKNLQNDQHTDLHIDQHNKINDFNNEINEKNN